ncbi:putative berberine-like protein [Coleophoma cylindrospora]|uniref:Putative berberine-like protein n=1 Tax=Coleophoma cylindrospora TaxID=1849047 RepID=A0A3D8Q8Q3_9HELO|nr:putative berberine-like protein [Coleophoma cylindrospora]
MYRSFALISLGLTGLLQSVHAQETLESCLQNNKIQTSFAAQNSSTWFQDSAGWQGRVRPVPSGVAFPTTVEEVRMSLKCATDANVKVAALNGGHSFVSYGVGGNDGALVLNMTAFNSMSYDKATGYFTVGGGAHVGPAATFLWNNYGAHFPHVRGNWVGLAGSAIGGGLGTTSRFLGTTMNNLVSVTMALANGTVVEASESVNTDLFFAIQGAGSSYGIILSLTLKTWKPTYPDVTKWTIVLPTNTTLDIGVKALLAVQEYGLAESTPDEMYIRWRLTVPVWGGSGYFYGDPIAFSSVIQPLMDALPVGTNLTTSVADFWTMENDATGGLNATSETSNSRSFYVKSIVLTKDHPFTYENAAALYNFTSLAFNRSDISQSGLLDLWGGRANAKLQECDTANAQNGNLWIVRWEGDLKGSDTARGQPTLYTQNAIDYVKSGMQPFLAQLAAEGAQIRGYANYRDSELTPQQWSSQLYPNGNFARLQQIKRVVDPSELFNPNAQSIPV